MAIRYRSVYRRYLFYRRLRTILACLGGMLGAVACYLMYRNLQQSGLALGRKEAVVLMGTMVLGIVVPWLALTPLVRKPSEL